MRGEEKDKVGKGRGQRLRRAEGKKNRLQSSLLMVCGERHLDVTRCPLAVLSPLCFGRLVTVVHHSRRLAEEAGTPAAGTEEKTQEVQACQR